MANLSRPGFLTAVNDVVMTRVADQLAGPFSSACPDATPPSGPFSFASVAWPVKGLSVVVLAGNFLSTAHGTPPGAIQRRKLKGLHRQQCRHISS